MKKKSIVLSSVILGIATLGLLVWLLPLDGGFSSINVMSLFFQMASDGPEAIILAVPLLLAFIFNIIVFAFGLVALLNACGVVKNAKLARAFRIVDLVLVSVSTLFLLFPFVMFIGQGTVLIGMLILVLFAIALIVLTAIDLNVAKKALNEQTNANTLNEEKAE